MVRNVYFFFLKSPKIQDLLTHIFIIYERKAFIFKMFGVSQLRLRARARTHWKNLPIRTHTHTHYCFNYKNNFKRSLLDKQNKTRRERERDYILIELNLYTFRYWILNGWLQFIFHKYAISSIHLQGQFERDFSIYESVYITIFTWTFLFRTVNTDFSS